MPKCLKVRGYTRKVAFLVVRCSRPSVNDVRGSLMQSAGRSENTRLQQPCRSQMMLLHGKVSRASGRDNICKVDASSSFPARFFCLFWEIELSACGNALSSWRSSQSLPRSPHQHPARRPAAVSLM